MPDCLQMLNEQTLGPFHRDRQPVTEAVQLTVELGQAGDIVRDTQLQQPFTVPIDDTELVMLPAPVDAGKHRPLQLIVDLTYVLLEEIGHLAGRSLWTLIQVLPVS